MKKIVFLSICVLLSSCGAKSQKGISVAAWNAQTFFDASDDGTEYAEFRGEKSGWSEQKYVARLKKISSQICRLESDVVVLVEMESEPVLRDIANFLDDGAFEFAAFAGERGGVFGCAVFSKLPILQVRTHQLDFRFANLGKQPSMRPLVEVQVAQNKSATRENFLKGECAAEDFFTILACHWKSKSGGAEKSEVWRLAQGALLAQTAQNVLAKFPNSAILACGDFNKDFCEFEFSQEGLAVFCSQGENLYFENPWRDYIKECADNAAEEKGTYFFNEKWEKIDNFFLLKKTEGEEENDFSLADFQIADDGDFADAEGRPARYKVFSGAGSSDHFPIRARLLQKRE